MGQAKLADAPYVSQYLGGRIELLRDAMGSDDKARELYDDLNDTATCLRLERLLERFNLIPGFIAIWQEIGNPATDKLADRMLQALAELEVIEFLTDKLGAQGVTKRSEAGPDLICRVNGETWCVEVTCIERPSKSGLEHDAGAYRLANSDQSIDTLAGKIDGKVGQLQTCNGLKVVVLVAERSWAAMQGTEHATWLMFLREHGQDWLDRACAQARVGERGISRVYLRTDLDRWSKYGE